MVSVRQFLLSGTAQKNNAQPPISGACRVANIKGFGRQADLSNGGPDVFNIFERNHMNAYS